MTASSEQLIGKLRDYSWAGESRTGTALTYLKKEELETIIAALRAAERQEPVAWLIPEKKRIGRDAVLCKYADSDHFGGNKEHLLQIATYNGWTPLYPKLPGAADEKIEEEYFILNGYHKRWRSMSHFDGRVVSYEEAVEWSGIDSDREKIRERVYTVTYSSNPRNKAGCSGTLSTGDSTPFENGMIFNVTKTDKA